MGNANRKGDSPECFFYKLNKNQQKKFYSCVSGSPRCIPRSDLNAEWINDIQPGYLDIIKDFGGLEQKKKNTQLTLEQYEALLMQHAIDVDDIEEYKLDFKTHVEACEKRHLDECGKHTSNECLSTTLHREGHFIDDYCCKVSVSGRKTFFSYITTHSVSRSSLPKAWFVEDIKTDPYQSIMTRAKIIKEIENADLQLQINRQLLENCSKTVDELQTERLLIREQFEQRQRERQEQAHAQRVPGRQVMPKSVPPRNTVKKLEPIEHIDQEVEDLEKQCAICWENQKCICLNCGHICLCAKCYNALLSTNQNVPGNSKCPVCREQITTGQLVYL